MGNKTRHTDNLVSDNNIFVDIASDRVGIGSTQPTAKLNIVGIVSATSFFGDGSNLTGVSGGGASVQVSDNAPSNPSEGDLWWRSSDGKGFIYYNDGNSNQWVEFNPSAVGIAGISTSGTSTFNVISANTYQGITTSMISDYGNGLSGGGGGISLTDLSVTTANTPLQLGALAYNNSNGVFTFTPPDIVGQARPGFSVGTANNPLQLGAISYASTSGVFTYTPPDLSNYLQVNGDGSQLTGVGSTDLVTTWTLGANGSSHYTFTGPGVAPATDDPTIYLVRGQTYKFENRSGGHPFRIQYEFQNTSGTAYNDGIVNNAANHNTDLYWEVRNDAPDLLHYQCTAHGGMSGRIVILGDVVSSGSWTASAGTAQTIDTITGVANNAIKTAEYTIHIENGSNMQAQKVLVMQDGTTAFSQEYAIMHKSGLLVSMSATINGGNLLLQATPETGVSGTTTYKVTRQTMR